MLLIIHNLPANTSYTDVKSLIKDKCGLTEMIVDNLVPEGNNKKVTVGLPDEGDAAILVRKINGLYVCDQQLYVEDVRQNKSTYQPYRASSMQTNQCQQSQYDLNADPQFGNQFFGQQDAMLYQSSQQQIQSQISPCPPAPNFGVPFYMTAQNQNVGNNLQYMVQYPKPQGHMGNESYEGRDIGFKQQYGGGIGDRSRSIDHDLHRERSSKPFSRWNDYERNRSDGRRGRDRPNEYVQPDNADRSYKDRSYRDLFQSRSKLDYGSNRFEKSSNRSEPHWDFSDRSTFGESTEPLQVRRFNQGREPQRFRVDNFSQSRGSDYESRRSDFSKKRPYETPDKNTFSPKNKKFCNNQQFNLKTEPGISNQPYSINNTYFNKSPIRPPMQQNWSHVQPKGQQSQLNRPQMQPKGLQKSNNKPQWQQNKAGVSNNQPNFQKKQDKFLSPTVPKIQKPLPGKEELARYEAWRVQAASVIATKILKKMRIPRNKRNPVVIKLKACVRARIDVITGDDMSLNLWDMINGYRVKFKDDEAFYNAVVEKVNRDEDEELEVKEKEPEGSVNAEKSEIVPKTLPIVEPAVKALPNPLNPLVQRLPKYPEGNKKVMNQLKQALKREVENELLYNLDVECEKALGEELDKFDEVIKRELENPEGDVESTLSQFMNDVFIRDLRKIMTLHVKKRVLNIQTNLAIRVNCQPKSPKRDLLDAFLKNYGVVSLKPSDRNKNVYIAICDSYKSFDTLCKESSTTIDNLKITFRPLHLTGPPAKGRFKNKRQASNSKTLPIIGSKSGNEDNQMGLPVKGNFGNIMQVTNSENPSVTETKSDNHDATITIEPKIEHENKQNVKGTTGKSNNKIACKKYTKTNDDKDVIVIEDNILDLNNVIIIDENDDKITVDNKQVICLDGAPTNGPDFKAPGNYKGAAMDTQTKTADTTESTTNNDEDGSSLSIKDVKGGSSMEIEADKIEHKQFEVIDNDNIADDDLEDF